MKADEIVTTDHRITVPLDHGNADSRTIEVFAREVAARDGLDRPYLVFLQGGPGSEAPRPVAFPLAPAWLERALASYRVIMLDQRGTGLSTPYGEAGPDPVVDAEWLTHFRADSIVADAELLRESLGVASWTLLGQSFGGFCALHYLSVASDSLSGVIFTGGLPPVGTPVDDVYAATFERMRTLSRRYFDRYPQDAARFTAVLDLAAAGRLRSPAGEPVSARMVRTLGHHLGMDGGAEQLHFLLELDPESIAFSHDLQESMAFRARNPIYSVLHESCYADGGRTDWSSARVEPDDYRTDPLLLTGEHIFPWHFEEEAGLRPYAAVAALLAEHEWPRLFDADALRSSTVPCAAAIYTDDPYVDLDFSTATADLLPSMTTWITDEYLHSGLRTSGPGVLDRLIGLLGATR